MKTKVIECFVSEDVISGEDRDGFNYGLWIDKPSNLRCKSVKATLTIEIPEQKIEVTPSMIEEAFRKSGAHKYNDSYGSGWSHKVISQLFKGDDYENKSTNE